MARRRASQDRADVRLFLGRQGSGKTSLAQHQLDVFTRALIFDPNGEEIHARRARIVTDKRELVELVSTPGPMRICWRGFQTMDMGDAFEWGNRCAWAGEGFALLWDEVDRCAPNGWLPRHAAAIVNSGRHRRLKILAGARRPLRLPRDLTAAATMIATFKVTEPDDLHYLRRYMGSEAVAKMPDLARFHALAWDEEGWEVKKSPFRPKIPT